VPTSLIYASDGNFYGTTGYGGSQGGGIIFKLDALRMLHVLHEFDTNSLNFPGSLHESNKRLYGLVQFGSNHGKKSCGGTFVSSFNGSVVVTADFSLGGKFTPCIPLTVIGKLDDPFGILGVSAGCVLDDCKGSQFAVYNDSFNGDGTVPYPLYNAKGVQNPYGISLVDYKLGSFFVALRNGGLNDRDCGGIFFAYDDPTTGYLYEFDNTTGCHPESGPTLIPLSGTDHHGWYGVTYEGGPDNMGVLYKYVY